MTSPGLKPLITLGKGEPVIDPYEVVKNEQVKVPCRNFALVFTNYMFKTAKKLIQSAKKIGLYAPVLGSIKGVYNGVEVCITQLYFSAPASTMALELLIARGADKFIVIGEAGAIHPLLRIGDILIPTWGIREEGTSYHYMPLNYTPKPDLKMAIALEKEIKKLKGRKKIRVIKGGVWTTDAFFRETRDKVEKYSKMKVLAVEMESTALMTVAKYRGAKLAIALAISDELYKEKWNPGFKTKKLRKTERILVEAALNTITKTS